MMGLVLIIIIIILIVLLGALNKIYPENFFGTCQSSSIGSCPKSVKGKSCNPTNWACTNVCLKRTPSFDSSGNIIPNGGDCLNTEVTGCAACNYDVNCKCADS